jgi:formylmethanofuran dehydrogenase subunit C
MFQYKNRIGIFVVCVIIFLVSGFGVYHVFFTHPQTLSDDLEIQGASGAAVQESFLSMPTIAPVQDDRGYHIADDLATGIDITYANQTEEQKKQEESDKKELHIQFPKDYAQPMEIALDNERTITITDQNAQNYTSKILSEQISSPDDEQTFLAKDAYEGKYIAYTNSRKSVYYAYQKDVALNNRKLENWIVYDKPQSGGEQETYKIDHAKIKKNGQGQVEVYYFGDTDIQNEQVKAKVDPSLLARAQKTLEKDGLGDITQANTLPDFIIPEPYYIDKSGNRTNLAWDVDAEKNIISISFVAQKDQYPIALDPTLQFTAPGQSNSGDVIEGVNVGDYFATAMTSGDFNSDGKMDLAVSATRYSSDMGAVYIFYSDGSTPSTATADKIITGESGSRLGTSLAAGDFNADGTTDLAAGAYLYSTNIGRAYIFYNDGSMPTTAATADKIITGEANSGFGWSMLSGDFNADSRTDLVVGAYQYNSIQGRVYIFYNDGSIPTTAATADSIITGGATNHYFGYAFGSGDFNADGKKDLAIGSFGFNTAYIFYQNSAGGFTASIAVASANVVITGDVGSQFGVSFASGDFNSDGKTDVVVGANIYSSSTGRAYIFYQNGAGGFTASIAVASANVIITGETNSQFGGLSSGDFNADGKIDLVVNASVYASDAGRIYIFYNDGSIPTTAATADVIITGEASSHLGRSFATVDLNSDGKMDLVVGANIYASNTGRAYIFYSQNGQVNKNLIITGGAESFGIGMSSGDLNADGRMDLVVGAPNYVSSTGRTYIF